MSLQAVDFSGSMLNFKFADINANVTLSLESGDFVFIPGFSATDSISRINIPIDYLTKLFLFRINYTDFSNSNWDNAKYAMNVWQDVSFSVSDVDVTKAIIPTAKSQLLQYDYIRYLLKEITGTNYLNGLFRNKTELLTKVVALDTDINNNIKSTILTCGTQAKPKDNSSYYNNPCLVLVDSILAQDNVLETDNVARRASFLAQTNTTIINYNNSQVDVSYVICGKLKSVQHKGFDSVPAGVEGDFNYYYHDLFLDVSTNSVNLYNTTTDYPRYVFSSFIDPSENTLSDPDFVFTNIDISNITFYSKRTSTIVGNSVYTGTSKNYYDFYNKFWPVQFVYGDSLSVRLTYKPLNNMYLGKEIRDRSYEVYLDVGLDSSFNVRYDASGSEGLPSLIVGSNPRRYKSNNINNSFQYVLFNASPPNLYLSPYNFYPTLADIKDISFNTFVLKHDYPDLITTDSARAEFDASWNPTNENWYVSIFTRPRNKGLTDAQGVGFDRFDSVPIVKAFDSWSNFNITTLRWANNLNASSTWSELLEMPVVSTTPYGSVSKNGDQQIMAIAIANTIIRHSTIQYPCRVELKEVRITFNDGRYIYMT
jgi:hypothetical protein